MLTYAELHQRAQAIAVEIAKYASPGERVLMLYPPGLEFVEAFFGCLYAGAIAVPAYPPRKNQKLGRLEAILEDCHPALVMTTQNQALRDQPIIEESMGTSLPWLCNEQISQDLAASPTLEVASLEDIAFLQYTSGSTGHPKGVMVSHGNLMHNEEMIRLATEHTEETVFVSWLPMFHDMGLIGNLVQTVYMGCQCVLMSPASFLQKPVRWLEAITKYRGTTSCAPNFAFNLCAEQVTEAEKAHLDLSSWTVAVNAAEPIRAETLDLFTEAFAQCGFSRQVFYPCFGLAEGTLIVSGCNKGRQPLVLDVDADSLTLNKVRMVNAESQNGLTLVSSGHEWYDQEIVIVDPETNEKCAADQVGEIWTRGASVAQGYWHQEEETKKTFAAYLATGEGPYLRTGDLGFLHHSELYVTGRHKDLIIIRGLNHYPQDIELSVVQSHEAFRPDFTAAFSVDVAGEERLVVVQELKREFRRSFDLEELAKAAQEAVNREHQLQIYDLVLLKPGRIPKTSSGKIQRRACVQMYQKDELEILARHKFEFTAVDDMDDEEDESPLVLHQLSSNLRVPRIEAYLQRATASLLHTEVSEINVGQSLTALGLDSLRVSQLSSRIRDRLGVLIPIELLFVAPDLHQVAVQIDEAMEFENRASSSGIERCMSDAPQLLSFSQRRLWFLYRFNKDDVSYNLCAEIEFRGSLDVSALQNALQALVNRHEALRTRILERDEEAFQEVLPYSQFDIPVETLSEVELQTRLKEEAATPFDLLEGPLFRFQLIHLDKTHHVLIVNFHHLVMDGWSVGVFLRELSALYVDYHAGQAPSLRPAIIQYKDFTNWQRQILSAEKLAQLQRFWQQYLADVPYLELPTDYPRPAMRSYRGEVIHFTLPQELTSQLKQLAREQQITLFSVLMAAYQILLSRYSGQQDICVGTTTANRQATELESLVGFVSNTVPIRADLSGEIALNDYLSQVQESILNAFAHQDMPFEEMVDSLGVPRDLSRTPVFQTLFVLQKEPLAAGLNIADLKTDVRALATGCTKFDLSVEFEEVAGQLEGTVEYCRDLFFASTVERMMSHYQNLLVSMVGAAKSNIRSLSILSETEKQQQLYEWNATEHEYPSERGLMDLFTEQVERDSERVALSDEGAHLTYGELGRRSTQLASYLLSLGLSRGAAVGLCVERSIEMVVGIYGILKAGGAYVPLEPSYPQERLQYMLQDCGAGIVLAESQTVSSIADSYDGEVVLLDSDWGVIEAASPESLPAMSGEDRAYIIYTSGSTGQPKGVSVRQGSVVNLLYWMHREYGFSASERMLLKTPFSFDVSVVEFFWPLLFGGELEIAKPEGHKEPGYLVELIRSREINLVAFVPSMLSVFLEEEGIESCTSIRRVAVAGEALVEELQHRFYQRLPWAELDNIYGPTEATVYSSYWHCERGGRGVVPIGRPIDNGSLYILDSSLNPVPVGVSGELHIGGVGLAEGYVNNDDLTAEKFISHPFREGERIYKTGDLARYRTDGTVEYLGRIDHQVKVRGFRIELGEIESALQELPEIREAVVMSKGLGLDARLVAYVVMDGVEESSSATEGLKHSLGERLPEFMVPQLYVPMEALPLTANGKVDRKALPEPELVYTGVEYEAPRTATEEVLCEIWQSLLPVERVGIHDNFFELGGHSLLAVQLMARIRISFNKRIEVSALFAAQTVAELAELIDQEQRLSEWSPIIRLQEQGDQIPIFAVHSGNTLVVTYNEIARGLGKQQPFYGIEPRGLIEDQTAFDNLTEMASYYIDELRQIQPEGPFRLMGHSFGGLVAFEMAQQLTHSGEQVDSLILIDTYLPEYMTGFALAHAENFYDQFIKQSDEISKEEFVSMGDEALADFISAKSLGLFDAGQIIHKLRVLRGFDKMVKSYQIEDYSGEMLLFRAEQEVARQQRDFESSDLSAGWRDTISGSIEICVVPGSHDSMLRRDNVSELVTRLQKSFRKTS